MYKALNYWVFGGFQGEKTPYEFIDYASEQGLDGVEFTVGDALDIDISQEECLKIRSYADSKNVQLRSLATGFYWGCSLSSEDEAERNRAIEFTKKYLYIGSYLGVETILVVPGATRVAFDESRPIVSYKKAWELSQKSLKELGDLAIELDINIALENVWNRFLLSPKEWELYLNEVNNPKIGIYFDAGNCCIYGMPEDYVEILGDKIKAVHLKNFEESDCAGGLHGFGDNLLKGAVNFEKLFAALKAINYTGPFTVEMIPFSRLPDLVLPDMDLANSTVEKLKSL